MAGEAGQAAASVRDPVAGTSDSPGDGQGRLVVVIAGPTAVGKSDVAMALAELVEQPAELISADSVQVYRGLDIGSNKPTRAEQERCPIHLVDWREPGDPCNVADWTREALSVADGLHARGALPIVVGGSCMYVDWLVHGERDAAKSDPEVQARVLEELRPFQEAMDWEGAVALLAELDPERPQRIMRNNWRMLARQIEVARTPSERTGRAGREGYDMRGFFLNPPDRQALFDRIDTRCLAMLGGGLLEEVADLLEQGSLELDSSAGLAIGYRQVIEYLARPDPQDGDAAAFCDFVRNFGTATRAYSRSQVQWFQRDPAFKWLPADPQHPQAVAAEVARLCSLPREAFLAEAAGEAEARAEATAAGAGGGAVQPFVSRLARAEALLGPRLPDLLRAADACTLRVPSRLRRAAEPPPELLDLPDTGVPVGKVYWGGRHKRWGWGNPLGKLHRQGMQLMEAFGWRRVEDTDCSALPAFCWSTRKAGDFPARGPEGQALPLVRPFPQDFTRRLDNKLELATHLAAAGHAEAHPPTWPAERFLEEGPAGTEEEGSGSEVWFLKHSMGVRGQGVHAYAGAGALRRRLEELGARGCRGFVVQRGVAPPALRDGRKWVVRAHALLHGGADGSLSAYCHRDMIVIQNGQPYTDRVDVRAAHISSAGAPKHWPKPVLLEDQELAAQVQSLASRAFASVWRHAPRGPYTPACAELCQVFGLDVAVDAAGRAWLLEVNNYPAIASGTMDHVDPVVYTDLVRDVLRLAVLPRLEGAPAAPGGFVRLAVEDLVPAPAEGSGTEA